VYNNSRKSGRADLQRLLRGLYRFLEILKFMRFTILIFLFLSGCKNENGSRITHSLINDSLIKVNEQLHDSIKLVDSLDKFYQLGKYAKGNNNNSIVTSEKYCFVLLKVTQTEPLWGKDEYYNYCTKIQEISTVDEDSKYRLMDDAQEIYLGSPSGTLHNGSVIERECFIFDSYQEASREREKYLIQQ
jgi:hypothetical protein